MSNDEVVQEAVETPEPPFSVFQKYDRLLLMLILSSFGFWSTSSNQVFFPALPIITKDFGITPTISNLSVVAYLFFQGVTPAVTSSLALYYGSRPVLIGSLAGYVAVCIAISQVNAFWLLAVLRCLQAASIAPVIAIGAGVSGDVCTRENRGGFIGTVSGFQLIGSGFGAVIGSGLLQGFHTWRAIFVFLAIGGSVSLINALALLPETSRQYVGNGSIVPSHWYHKSLLLRFPGFRKKLTNDMSTLLPRKPFNLFGSFVILANPDVLFVLAPAGLVFASWTAMLASLSTVLEDAPYNYSVMHVGFVYMPQGVATICGSFVSGRTLNWYYGYRVRIDEKEGIPVNYIRARLDICFLPICLVIIGLNLFGWSLQYRLNIAAVYISTILVAFSVSTVISCSNTILVDMNPQRGHASSSCLNLSRCLLGVLFVGVLDLMIGKMGLGGTYTFFAGLCTLSTSLLFWRFYVHSRPSDFKA